MGFWPQNGQKIAKIPQKHPKMTIYWIHINSKKYLKHSRKTPKKHEKYRFKTSIKRQKNSTKWVIIGYTSIILGQKWLFIGYT